jgi:hypothetical protein
MKKTSYKALRWIIDISYFLSILGGIVLMIGLSLKIHNGNFSIGVRPLKEYVIDKEPVVSKSEAVTEPSVVAKEVTIKFKTTSNLIMSFLAALSVFGYGYLFSIIFILRRFVHSLDKQNPFIIQNVKRLQVIGFLLLLIEPLRWIARYFLTQLLDNYFIHTFHRGFVERFGYSIGFNLASVGYISSWITVGLIVLVIAEVFRQGLKMKEEQDLTI